MIFSRRSVPNLFAAVRRAARSLFVREAMVLATGRVVIERGWRCGGCPQQVSGQCRLCTCVVKLKVLMATETCPAGRWGAQTHRSTGL